MGRYGGGGRGDGGDGNLDGGEGGVGIMIYMFDDDGGIDLLSTESRHLN